MRAKDFLSEQKHISESLNKPYPIKLEKSEFNDYDFIARLDDGTPLHIMITFYDPSQSWLVEFYRDNRQDISNTGDAFRVFATVLAAIEKVIEEENPNRITFFAEKTEDGHDAASRIKLYNRLVQRHASDLGYNAEIRDANSGQTVMYILTRKQDISESTLNEFAAFHGTFRPSLARFKPLSHFGTYESAEERLHHLKTTNPKFADVGNGYIYELDLGIQNPGVVKDYPEIRDPGPSSMKKIAVWSKDLLRDPRFSSYTGTNPINKNPNSNGKDILKHFATLADSGYWADFPYTKFISLWINFLRDVGLDGLVYSNKVENVGSKSFVTFNPDQIQIKGKPKKISVQGITEEEVTEKWSAKYKRSINCNNPKGFSQRAHCQGRKKGKK